jgi:hypothetical protein
MEIIGAGEGIRTLDPNLGKMRLDEIFFGSDRYSTS